MMEVVFAPVLAKKMTISSEQLVLTDSETLDEVLKCLAENFSIETQGAYDQQSLFEILVKAASSGDSIENTAKILKNIPTVCQVVERKYQVVEGIYLPAD
jgi:hypothetical protein